MHTLKKYLLLFTLLVSSQTFAIGLGNVELHSTLGEPLNVSIKLNEAIDFNDQQLLMGIAPDDVYKQMDVELTYLDRQLKFAISRDDAGNATIHVTTHKPLREPYVNFILEVRYPGGKLQKEISLLLDKPRPLESVMKK